MLALNAIVQRFEDYVKRTGLSRSKALERFKVPVETCMVDWLINHNEMPTGRHAIGSVHRRYALARRRHRCGRLCKRLSPMELSALRDIGGTAP